MDDAKQKCKSGAGRCMRCEAKVQKWGGGAVSEMHLDVPHLILHDETVTDIASTGHESASTSN